MKVITGIALIFGFVAAVLFCISGCGGKSAEEIQKDIKKGKFEQGEVLGALESESFYRREVAAQALADYGDKEVIKPLIKHMHTDKAESVRKMCLSGLLERDDVTAEMFVPELIKVMKEQKDDNIRQKAVFALGEKRNEEGYKMLLEALKDAAAEVRVEAVRALAKFQKKEALNELGKMFEDEDVSVRRAAVDTIAAIGGPDAIDLMIPALSNSDYAVQKTAVEKLGELKARKAGPNIVPLLNIDNASLRESAAKTLGILRERTAVKPLIVLLKEEQNIDTKRAVTEALGKIGGPEVVDEITSLLDDGDNQIRELALDALVHMKAESEEFKAKLRYMSTSDPYTQLRQKAKEALDKMK